MVKRNAASPVVLLSALIVVVCAAIFFSRSVHVGVFVKNERRLPVVVQLYDTNGNQMLPAEVAPGAIVIAGSYLPRMRVTSQSGTESVEVRKEIDRSIDYKGHKSEGCLVILK